MRRTLLMVVVILAVPVVVGAWGPRMGLFLAGKMHYFPEPFTLFDVGLYIIQDEYYITAVEYRLETPTDPSHTLFVVVDVTYPPNHSIELGDPLTGHAITYWPPCTGFPDGYDLLCTYTCLTLNQCIVMPDYPLVIGPHPDSGELRATYAPDNDFVEIIGLGSYLCPEYIDTDNDSWGSIKALGGL